MKSTYKEVAEIIRAAKEKHDYPLVLEEIEMEIAHVFAKADPEFSYTSFLVMCGGGVPC